MSWRPPFICAPPDVKASLTRMVASSTPETELESDHRTCRRDSVKNRRPSGPFSENRTMLLVELLVYRRDGRS